MSALKEEERDTGFTKVWLIPEFSERLDSPAVGGIFMLILAAPCTAGCGWRRGVEVVALAGSIYFGDDGAGGERYQELMEIDELNWDDAVWWI